jgi:fructose-1,6-bisphosphatase/inositol monophosphatase family enzyme
MTATPSDTTVPAVPERHAEPILELFHSVADAVGGALATVTDWGPSGLRAGQYAVDVAVDGVVVEMLVSAGFGVLSEESGLHHAARDVIVVVDPLDGSTNASHGIPWFGTALCAVDETGPWVAMVADQSRGGDSRRWTAVRGEGAWADGRPISASGCADLSDAIVGLSGLPPSNLGWRQFRALGASALDLCLVAEGVLDGFIDCSPDAHGVWDYAAGSLICREAGADVADALGRELIVLDPAARRTPVAGATTEVLVALLAARRSFP